MGDELSGRLRFGIGDEEVVRGPGDAAHFDADRPHRFGALDGRDAEAIVVACALPYLLVKATCRRSPIHRTS